jgi:hypothetical protein
MEGLMSRREGINGINSRPFQIFDPVFLSLLAPSRRVKRRTSLLTNPFLCFHIFSTKLFVQEDEFIPIFDKERTTGSTPRWAPAPPSTSTEFLALPKLYHFVFLLRVGSTPVGVARR